MKIDRKRVLLVFAVFFLALLLVCSLISLSLPGISGTAVLAAFMAASAVAVCLLIKKRNILAIAHRQVIYLMPVIAVGAVLAYFALGLKFGYSRVITEKPEIYVQALLYIVVIVASELIRSVLVAQKGRLLRVLSYVALLAVDIRLLASNHSMESFTNFVNFIGLTVFPMIASNLLYHVFAVKYGALPNILYKTVIYLYPCFIPILPNVPEVMLAFLRIILYLFMYAFIRAMYTPGRFVASHKSVVARRIAVAVGVVVAGLYVMLISCQFRYGLLVIGTESMTGSINKGDAIVYEEYNGTDTIRVGDVLAFERNGVTIIHRVVDITSIDGEIRYFTKGDANEDRDSGYVTTDMISGTVHFCIRYVGYPTLWLRSLFK